MYNKLSLKIGVLFFAFILGIQALLFGALYITLVNERVDEVMGDLLARGEMHSKVLADSFEPATLEHVGLMESATDFVVIITDASGNVLIHSDPIEPEMQQVVNHTDYGMAPAAGEIIEERWQNQRYIASDSPITINGEHGGHVFMFAGTGHIQRVVEHLKDQFIIAGLITVAMTVIAIFLLSRFITLPLIQMKEATEQLSKGNNKVELRMNRNDELGELARAINTLSTDLAELKSARNEFLASISHELRTPLTYIKGYADIISRPEIPEEERERFVGIIREESNQLAALIQNLFELAKMDDHQFSVQLQDVELGSLLRHVESLVRPAFEAKGIDLEVNCPDDIQAFIDPDRFQQVLLNVLDNARKHSESGGRVVMAALQLERGVEVSVADEGEGIPSADLPYVFDRLYRVEKSRSRLSGGTGLGLSIAKEIVELHGGSIAIDSEPAQGTRVRINVKGGGRDAQSSTGG